MEGTSLTKIVITAGVVMFLVVLGGFYYYYQFYNQEEQPGLILLENGEPDPNQTVYVEANLSPEARQRLNEFFASQASTTVVKEELIPASEE